MKTPETDTLQKNLINKIKDSIPPSHSLAEEIAEVLEISSDSAYRRIRGETLLTITETARLCNHFKISFDSLGNDDSGTVSFSYCQFNNEESDFIKYLKSILSDMQKIKKAENRQIIYAAEDIPIFHMFRFPELAAFKAFYWMKAVMNVHTLEGKKFDPKLVSKEIMDTGRQIFELYTEIPSIEIWTEVTLVGMLKQIEYYWESGIFTSKADALTVCEQLKETLLAIQRQAELCTKFVKEETRFKNENNYQLYQSEIEIGNNCILVNIGENKTVYLTHNTFNKLETSNMAFSNETGKWMKNLIGKSNLISGVSEKQRYRFFLKAIESVDKLKSGIEKS